MRLPLLLTTQLSLSTTTALKPVRFRPSQSTCAIPNVSLVLTATHLERRHLVATAGAAAHPTDAPKEQEGGPACYASLPSDVL